MERACVTVITKAVLRELALNFPIPGDWVLVSTEKTGGPLFWRPEEKGYTTSLLAAGVYPKQYAKKVARASHGEVKALRIGLNKPFLRMLGRFDYHVQSELTAVYEIAKLRAIVRGDD